jgi:hypothetical protein
MNAQERMIDSRTFRIAAIAVAAVAVLVLAAYLFGTGLRADTSALGANSADVRAAALAAQAQRRADFYADVNNSAKATTRAAALAALEKSRADFHAEQNAAAEAARWASVATADKNFAIFYNGVNVTNAAVEAARPASSAADPYQNEWMGFTSPESVGARLPSVAGARASGSPSIKPEGVKTGGVLFAAPGQYQWIKPEGISTAGAK